MGTLRDLLNKQKAEQEARKNGGPIAKPVLQSQAVAAASEKTTPIPNQPETKKETVGTVGENTGNGPDNSGEKRTPVVEQRPLSLLERARLRKTQSVVNAITEVERPVEASTSPNIHINSQIPERIKIEDRHEEKKNDGVVDTIELKRNLEYLANNIEQKELVGQIVRTIALQLKQSPELTPYMTDANVDLVVRGLRRSYSIVARKKSEAAEKRKSGSKNNDELTAMFRDAGLADLDLGLK
jgi:hypothetical protein